MRLTERATAQSGSSSLLKQYGSLLELSDPTHLNGKGVAQWIKGTPGITE